MSAEPAINVTRYDHHHSLPQPVKMNLNKKLLPKQKTVQIFIFDAEGFRKTENENPPTREIGVAS